MKKLIGIVLMVAMVVSFSACGGSESVATPEIESGVENLALKLFEDGKITEDMLEP